MNLPSSALPSSSGENRSLSELKGKKVIVYFYPKDDTSGCTKEACAFKDTHADFSELNAVILGVSKDPMKSHEKFINKYELPFELLSDEELEWNKAFEVWKEKSMYGRKYMGTERSTFLIDENGNLVKEWRKVKVTGHIEEVLETVRSL